MVDAVKILGALLGNGSMSSGAGGDILKSVLGAAMGGGGQSGGGGLGDLVGSVLGGGGGSSQQSGGGGLGGLVGSVLGGGSNQQQAQAAPSGGGGGQGGLGGLLGGLLGGGAAQGGSGGGGDLNDLLGAAMKQFGQQKSGHQPQHEDEFLPQGMNRQQANDDATTLIRAMVNAAKSDGRVDEEEQQNILKQLGEVTQDEINFVRQELQRPLDIDGFVQSVPQHLAQQVYAVSVLSIDLDTNQEAKYLHHLAQATGISQQMSNQIHQQLGAPALYS